MAPHSWIYNILPHYRIYNSKLISKKFPKKLKALLKATFCIQILAISHLSRNRYSFQILRPFWWDHLIA